MAGFTLDKARSMLQQYTLGSKLERIRRLQWGHNHIAPVERILNDNTIKTVDALILRLEAIPLVNQKGALAGIINNMKEKAAELAQPKTYSWAQKAIAAFLNYFNYLNPQNKRQGFGFFLNKPLTTALETAATELNTQLSPLMDTTQSDEETFSQFHTAIRTVIDTARRQRQRYAPVQTHIHSTRSQNLLHQRNHLGGIVVTGYTTYKEPYGNGKFEKNLISGLKQASKLLEDNPKEKIDLIVKEIEQYSPPERTEVKRTHFR